MWYAYGSFGVFLYSSLLGYFVNYKQIVFSADQKEYKNTIHIQGWIFVKVLLQMIAIYYLNNGYLYWMVIEIVMATITSITLNYSIKKEYKWLHTSTKLGMNLRRKYPEIVMKIKQIFFHKIGGFVLLQTSPIIIYAYTSLTLVGIYGNYLLIINGITLLMQSLFNSVSAGVGNLVAEKKNKKIKQVFWELTVCRMWLASIICYVTYKSADLFITIWVGEAYILEHSAFIVLLFITFISLTRTSDIFISAYGMFQDIAAPIVESILNIGLSVLLGYYWGLFGILLGVAISQVIIILGWKPYFLYKYGFKLCFLEYLKRYTKYILVIFISMYCANVILKIFDLSFQDRTLVNFIYYASLSGVVYASIISVNLFLLDKSMRYFVKRMLGVIESKM